MPICSSGISREKAGLATSIVVDQAYIRSLLPAGLAWLYPYLPWMHGLEIGDVGAFCSVDPPTWTVPTGAQIFDFITGGNFANVNLVQQFIQDVTRAYLWYSLCECASVTTPAPPTAPTAPTGLPAVNPPTVVQPNVAEPCLISPWLQQNIAGLSGSTGFIMLPQTTGLSVFMDSVANPAPTAGFQSYGLTPQWWVPSPLAFVRGDARIVVPYTASTHQTLDPPAGATALIVNLDQNGPPYNFGSFLDLTVRIYCNGDLPTGVNSPCCPPDPILHATLLQMNQTLQLLQRQLAPFAYVSGPVHSGLSGTGTVAVSGILGVLLNISIPSRAGLIAGTPQTSYDVGWINFGTADGYELKRPLRSDSQLVFPEVAGTWTIVGYTLLQGVTMTITELRREP